MLQPNEKIMDHLSQMTGDYKICKKKNDQNNPMNLASTFRQPAKHGKNKGRLISDKNRREKSQRKNYQNKPMNLPSTFRNAAIQEKIPGHLISNDD